MTAEENWDNNYTILYTTASSHFCVATKYEFWE